MGYAEQGHFSSAEAQKGFVEQMQVDTLLGKPNHILRSNPVFQATLPIIEATTREATSYHGTGRLQYDPINSAGIRDVFGELIEAKGLLPHHDVLDFTQGPMESVSLSPARLYALMYAQCHYEQGKSFFGPKRNSLIWAYYLAPMAWRGVSEAFIKRNPDYLQMADSATREAFAKDANKFHHKYAKTPRGKFDMPKGGLSDIPGNYPILIGTKSGSFEPIPVAYILDKHEKRSKTAIHINDFTHIEVPLDRVEADTTLLRNHGVDLPVYPIEWGIEYAKDLPFKTILDGK